MRSRSAETSTYTPVGESVEVEGHAADGGDTWGKWWHKRCDVLITAHFDVVIPLWCTVHGGSIDAVWNDPRRSGLRLLFMVEQGVPNTAPTEADDETASEVLRDVLGEDLSPEAERKLMAEMDGNHDQIVTKEEAQRWWQRYSDDMRTFDEAWLAVQEDQEPQGSDQLQRAPSLREISNATLLGKLVQRLLTPLPGQAKHAVAAARRELSRRVDSIKDDTEKTRVEDKIKSEELDPLREWLVARADCGGSTSKKTKESLHDLLKHEMVTQSHFLTAGVSKASESELEKEGEEAGHDCNARFDQLLAQWERIHRKELNGDIQGRLEQFLELVQAETLETPEAVKEVLLKLLKPTEKGYEVIRNEMDTAKSGKIDKSSARLWWLRNCTGSEAAFEKAWFAADEDSSGDLDWNEIKVLMEGKPTLTVPFLAEGPKASQR